MDDEPQRWLAEGIAQAKAGQPAQARELLLRVVERDERNVQAWLWLAGVVSDPQDKRIALENVLALEPDNTAAKAGLEWLDRQASAQEAGTSELTSAPQEHPYTPLPALTGQLTPDEAVLAPEGCPRCGRAVQESDGRCPHCAQPLTIYAPKLIESGRVALLTTMWVVQALANLADGLLMIMALQTMGGKSIVMGNINAILAGAAFRSGLPTAGLLQAMRLLLTIDAVALAWSLVVAVILPARRPTAPIVALFVAASHLVLAGGSLALGMSSPVVAAVRAILALFIGFWLLESQGDFEWQTVRQRLGLDSSAKSSVDHYTQGRYYRRIRQTAKAVLHLERAVELNPERCEYRVALANAYYALGRLDRTAEQLRAALRLNPSAPDVREFLQVVTARQSEGEPRVV
jgi:tetratricopeptide (TPR) repeat protein